MISLTVKAVDNETELYGKQPSALQTDISIEGTDISGTLKYVDDYSEAFGESEKSGHFLALEFEVDEGTTVKTKVVGGTHPDPVDCTEDKYCVYRITDKGTQSIEVIVTKNGDTETTTYSLTGLTLEAKSEP